MQFVLEARRCNLSSLAFSNAFSKGHVFQQQKPAAPAIAHFGDGRKLVVASQQIGRLTKLAGCLQLRGCVDLVTNVASIMLSLKP